MNLAFAKELYEAEWARRDQLQSAVSTPLGVLTLLGTGIAYCYVGFQPKWPAATVLFVIAEITAGVFFSFAAYCLVRSYVGYVYRRIPFPSEIFQFYSDLKIFHVVSGSSDTVCDSEYSDFLVKCLIDATDRNSENNAKRGEYLHLANKVSVWCMIALAAAAVPYAAEMRFRAEKIQKIEFVTHNEAAMANESMPTKAPQPAVPPVVVPPVRPTPPSNKDLRTEIKVPKTR